MSYPDICYTKIRKSQYPHLVYNPLLGASFHVVTAEPCELVSPQYYELLGWLNIPLPDYSLAYEPENKERKIDVVLQQLKEGVTSIQESSVFREFLLTMSKFHNYSIGNQILIMLQKRGATHVAGFVSWQEKFERHVKSGEKGIAILAPCIPSGPGFTEEIWRTSGGKEYLLRGKYVYEPVNGQKLIKPFDTRELAVGWLGEQGAQKEAEVERGLEFVPTRFKVVHVFDISQTEGKPLPEFVVPVLTGAANEDLFNKLLTLDKAEGLEVNFEPKELEPEIKGYFIGKLIWVKPDEARAQQLKTLLHETAHYYSESVYLIPKADAETIAESSAFVVGAHFGFDTGTRSFPYVALWSRDKKVLEANLLNIRKVSSRIIEALEIQGTPSTLREQKAEFPLGQLVMTRAVADVVAADAKFAEFTFARD